MGFVILAAYLRIPSTQLGGGENNRIHFRHEARIQWQCLDAYWNGYCFGYDPRISMKTMRYSYANDISVNIEKLTKPTATPFGQRHLQLLLLFV